MRILIGSAILASAAIALAPASASARTLAKPKAMPAATPAVQFNPANWLLVETKDANNYVHKASGAICIDNFRDLKLASITDYAPDGSNSSCQYDRAGENGLSRLTVYVYTAEGLTGPIAYKGAKDAITQFGQTTAVTVAERKEEGQRCHKGVIEPLAEAIIGRMKQDGGDAKDANLGLGLAMFEYDIPAMNGRAAQQQTSMLSVFQTGKWIVKTRVTVPKSDTSYADACNYGGFSSVALACVVSRKDGPAITED